MNEKRMKKYEREQIESDFFHFEAGLQDQIRSDEIEKAE